MMELRSLLLSLPAIPLPAEAAVLALLGKLLFLLMCMNVKVLNAVVLENIPLEILTSQQIQCTVNLSVFAILQDRIPRS